jgi:Holliday junction resolvase-like predicted endonuclease
VYTTLKYKGVDTMRVVENIDYKKFNITEMGDINLIENTILLYCSEKYGCFKILKANSSENYFLYGYRDSDKIWYENKCDVLDMYSHKNVGVALKSILPMIFLDNQYCKICFKEKTINPTIDKFRCRYIWEKTPDEIIPDIQRELYKLKVENWQGIECLGNQKPYLLYSLCPKHADERDKIISRKNSILNDVTYKHISRYLVNEANEEFLETFLCDHLYLIEKGMRPEKRQYRINGGIIDILARDANNTLCIIELKVVANSKSIIFQAAYYQGQFEEKKLRVITIAPGYDEEIFKALKNIKNIEIKYYFLNDAGYIQIKDFISDFRQ